jgi:hypothetical protein
MKKEMGMTFNQPRNQRVVRQIDYLSVVRRANFRCGTGFLDPFSSHQN